MDEDDIIALSTGVFLLVCGSTMICLSFFRSKKDEIKESLLNTV